MHRVLKRIAQSARVLLNREAPGRKLRVYPDDVFLVSYPKSGNTWLRFLAGNLVNPTCPVTFANIECRVPSIYLNPESKLRSLPRPRILKSHECFVPQYSRVIYVVRDPRDICLSYYHYLIKYRELPDKYPMEDFVPRFIQDDFEG
ncbi:MAG TPA: sulfotransferase domain-containing protein [Terriglobia bacterium]|nr:sulfotransferase domain-containing protein [Terriglobia bacterium]